MAADPVAHSTSQDSVDKTSPPSQNGHVNSIKSPWSAPDRTAGKIENPTLSKALKTIKVEDFKHIHQKPCVRDALLVGMGIGFGAGGLRASLGAPIFKACSWAVGSFCFGSWAMYEFCQRKRHLESQALKRAVEVIDRKRTQRQMNNSSEGRTIRVPENPVVSERRS